MDYTKFMDDNFDAKEWVNAAFRNQKDAPGVTKDQNAATMVMKLQVFIQEVNNILEEASQQALQNLPRVVRELDAVKQEASLLQDQMRTVKQDIQKVEQDTSHSMQALLKLDRIKSRMKSTADALKEADNWTTLSADMDEVFQSQNIDDITSKLCGMQQSLHILVDTPDYAEKCQHLEKLKNRLEAMLSPQLIAAFNAQSLDQTHKFVKIFESIERLPQMYKYYHKCHKNHLLQTWQSIWEEDKSKTALSDFYDLLLSTWHTQVKWCTQVFTHPVIIVLDLLTETLNTLQPPLGIVFNTLVGENKPLDTLVDLKQISDRCVKNLESAVDGYVQGSTFQYTVSLQNLLKAIYSPYQTYTNKYRIYEEVALTKHLDSIRLDHEEVIDTVQLLSESVTKLFSAASEANDRCQKLTNGFCYLGLLDAYRTYMIAYTREFRRVLINIREKCHLGAKTDSEDWSDFQNSLRIIQTCGNLLMQTEDLDALVASSILESLGHLVSCHSPTKEVDSVVVSVSHTFHFQALLFLVSESEVEALEAMVHKLEDGESPPVFTDIQNDLSKLSSEVHKFAFDIVFSQLKTYLSRVSVMEIWTSQSAGGALTSDLPTFSLSPQEYITKVGQYLMTLPQHLDPFTLQDSPALTVALKHGRLPFTNHQEVPEHLADLWLESVAMGTMHTYAEEILKIPQLTPHGCKQLITDIDYLCNVLEDLGLKASETLTHIQTLLQTKPDQFVDTAELMPQRISHTVANMRGIQV
ncbi:conserved oligomeric Golgi complex subunit 7-like isoform X1 [Biomphalaria glabrata]|uniref:Conserved oligomeric Golgi complex subunit 7 n=2 Tax=Biomphalaria glabrata TaxID=6526 RepID=A0A9U8E565_BIOGL|nr:conserved oligomeric Golgi complex subunit 7-like isoform X1 [Biomphalaria glabrata]